MRQQFAQLTLAFGKVSLQQGSVLIYCNRTRQNFGCLMKTGTSVALGTVFIGALATFGYLYYTGKLNQYFDEPVAMEEKNKRKKKQPSVVIEEVADASPAPVAAKESSPQKSPIAANPISPPPTKAAVKKKPTRLIDLELDEIIKLSAEQKEQLFYALLVEGENLVNQRKDDKAVEYFFKALSMIPSPTDILVAFEKSLPKPIFTKILTKLQEAGKTRQKEYFAQLATKNEYLEFGVKSETNEATGITAEHWAMKANKDIPQGTEILKEKPDVAVPTLSGRDQGIVTKDAFGSRNSASSFPGLDLPVELKKFLAELEDSEAHVKLMEHCRKNNVSLPLLMLRYIALLLMVELQQHSAPSAEITSFFTHYDHLRPAMRQPTDSDMQEAALLRAIFSRKNENIGDFLTNEIYAAMKYTMSLNCIALPNKEVSSEDKKNGEYFRVGGYTSNCKSIGVYHTTAHIDHANDYNCEILGTGDQEEIKVVAKKDIKKGDFITTSYVISESLPEKRQLLLMQHFGIFVPSSQN